MDTQQSDPFEEDQMSLREIFGSLWQAKWQILIATIAVSAIAAIVGWIIPKTYRAVVMLSPVTNTGSSQLGALGSAASEFGGLASLAGISVGGNSKKSESIAVLQSEALTEKYIEDNNLLPVLFKGKWDADKGRWKHNDPDYVPTLWKANEFFKKNVRLVTNDNKTGLVTLAITWKDPHMAAKWADDLVELCNDYLRGKAIAESDRSIAFLNEQAAKTNIVEARQAIFKSLEVEISKRVLAEGSKEYAFKVLDPARAPERPNTPRLLIFIIAGGVVGLIGGSALVLAYSGSRKRAPLKAVAG
jgi:uncharacterized protein involved in exopolysaccharide biosynthesis